MESPDVASASVPSSQNDMASASVPSSQNDELITIAGGVELEVAHQDGTKETVKVRQIPISKFDGFVRNLGNEAALIPLYCDKTVEWVDSLSIESADAIAEKGLGLNLPFYRRWYRRQVKLRESENTGAIGEMQKQIAAIIGALRSGNSQQSLPGNTSSPPKK
jgi:hypothetical protein